MKLVGWIGLSLVTVLAASAGTALLWRQNFLSKTVGSDRNGERYLRVLPGESFRTVAANLERSGWARPSWALRLEARVRRSDRRIVPGYYRHRSGETVAGLLDRLADGAIEECRVTIPEGLRLERILALLSDSTWVSVDSLRARLEQPAWRSDQQIPGPSAEGYIFPETYRIAKGADPDLILEQLLVPGRVLYRDSLEAPAGALGLDRKTLWTLASIIEAEAARPEERPLISAVYWNRLRRGMRLEADPTVLYALGRPAGPLTYADLEVDSPYNTYRVVGLPPGPICSPGAASLRAAVAPERGFEALFFVARGDGSHVFSKTLREHERAKKQIRRQQAASPAKGQAAIPEESGTEKPLDSR